MKKRKAFDLTKGSLSKNLIRLSFPIMLSNLMLTIYNLTDTWWLGRVGASAKEAVAAVGLTHQVVFFLSSFGMGLSIAGTAIISRFFGAKEEHKIQEVVGQFVIILVIFSLLFICISQFFLTDILHWLNVPPEIFHSSKSYLRIIMIGMVFMFTYQIYQSISHGLGDTHTPMIIQLIAVSINVVLDPFMIFGISFFPEMGVVGAGYATLFARIVAALLSIYFLRKHSPGVIPRFSDLRPKWKTMKMIIKIALPSTVSLSMTSFGFVFLQGFINTFGTLIISVYSIGNRLVMFFMLPAMGISSALSSIIGQNLGAGEIKRAEHSVHRAMILVVAIMFVGCSAVYLFGAELTKFFLNEPQVIEIGVRMFRVSAFAAFVFGVFFVFVGVFNGSGKTMASMVLSLIRLWVIRIPLVYLLSGAFLKFVKDDDSQIFHLLTRFAEPLSNYPYDALWWSMLLSNVISLSFAILIYKKGSWKKVTL